jgi:hypothetical protein
MNDRIKQLAEQAEFSTRDLHIQGDNFQKFAELVVRECLGVVSKKCASATAYNALVEHFGVAE